MFRNEFLNLDQETLDESSILKIVEICKDWQLVHLEGEKVIVVKKMNELSIGRFSREIL
jgi:hypothetical protein